MDVLTVESKAFTAIKQMFDEINEKIEKIGTKGNPLSEQWLDNQEVCLALRISKRTLQNMRDSGTIPFSQEPASKKIYYKASDIEDYLNKHYKGGFKAES